MQPSERWQEEQAPVSRKAAAASIRSGASLPARLPLSPGLPASVPREGKPAGRWALLNPDELSPAEGREGEAEASTWALHRDEVVSSSVECGEAARFNLQHQWEETWG